MWKGLLETSSAGSGKGVWGDSIMHRMRPAERAGGQAMICSVCGRKLKSPKSRELGYGPVCYKRVFGSRTIKGAKAGSSVREKNTCCDIPGQIELEDYLLYL